MYVLYIYIHIYIYIYTIHIYIYTHVHTQFSISKRTIDTPRTLWAAGEELLRYYSLRFCRLAKLHSWCLIRTESPTKPMTYPPGHQINDFPKPSESSFGNLPRF